MPVAQMRRRAPGLAAALALCALPAWALDLDRYRDSGEFGAWTILCDEETDMGSTTYFDCVVRSAGEPAVVLSALPEMPAVSRLDGAAEGTLTLGDRTIAFAACPDGVCPLGEAADAATAAFEAGDAILDANGQAVSLPADGLAEAVEEVLERLD